MSNILSYWPDFYNNIRDFVEIAATEDAELGLMSSAVNQLLDNQFVLSSNVAATKRREKPLKIQADPSTETLDFRRKRIINRYSTKPPLTIRQLQERLNFLVGAGRATVGVDIQTFTLTVTTALTDASVFKEVEKTVYAIKPANMVYNQRTAISESAGIEERIKYAPIKREMRLGAWHLGVAPFASLGEEVVIK